MLGLISKHSQQQWPWEFVRALSTAAQHVVSAEVAQHVSQYGRGLVQLPSDMVQTLDGYFKEAGLTGKTAKLRTRALTDQLKALTRSTARGGLQQYRTPDTGLTPPPAAAVRPVQVMTDEQLQEEKQMEEQLKELAKTFGPEVVEQHKQARERAAALAALPIPRTKGGRLKIRAKSALLDHISTHGFLSLPHEYVRAALDLPPSSTLDDPHRNMAVKQATPSYNETQALAYALSRLPGCYAASIRIFRELSVRLPDFQPRSLMDFGAGPGTAAWAAQEIWQESLSRVLAIEPSYAMRQLGAQLEAARRFAHPHAPLVHWRSELPPPARSQRSRRHQAVHDVVVASYVLGEVADPQERNNIIRRLWGLTSDMLVLIEPGTPAGAANIQEARAAILQHEARRTAKLQRRMADTSTSDGAAADSTPDSNLHQKLSSKWSGAHVVAPCPHDGPCPLAAPGTQAWCHFGTRFQRPSFMQAAKALKGTHMNPADHQDERYSYVVIRRGARPVGRPQVEISKSFMARNTEMPSSSYAIDDADSMLSREPHVFSDTPNSVPANSLSSPQEPQLPQSRQSSEDMKQSAAQSLVNQSLVVDVQPGHQQISPVKSQPADAPQQLFQYNPLLTAAEVQSLAALVTSVAADSQHEQLNMQSGLQPQSDNHQGVQAHAGNQGGFESAEASQSGAGLINKLIALEDAGVDWSTGKATWTQVNEPRAAACQASVSTTVSAPVEGVFASDVFEVDEAMDGELETGSEDTEGVVSAADLETAASATSTWSRIVRPPRKRGGHVILDLCVAHDSADGSGPQQSGQLERHIVAKSDAKKWMGRAAYKMVQQANWGDLWPTFYHDNPKKQVLVSQQN